MSSKEISMVPAQRLDNGLNPQLVFQDDGPLRFRVGDPGPGSKTRESTAFIDHKLFSLDRDRYFPAPQPPEFRRTLYSNGPSRRQDPQEAGDSDADEEEDDDVDDEDDDVEEVDEGGTDTRVHALVTIGNTNKSNSISSNTNLNANTNNNTNGGASSNRNNNDNGAANDGGVNGTADKLGNGKTRHLPPFGLGGEMMVKEGNARQSLNINSTNAVTIAEPDGDVYYAQYLQATEGAAGSLQKDMAAENGCGFSGRKESSFSIESGESLRAILSDPVTGALMDDAMILPCGHSFGAGGLQHVNRTKACFTCSHPVSEESIAPNLSLRAAVQAFRREDELQFYRSSKRKREKIDQDKASYGESTLAADTPRSRGCQFPFAVTDRVIIKGNKRTPQRFVGREAVVTTQCLNGWYVVKTLDNAESVKLQYRSLAKLIDDPSSKAMSSKMAANWL